MAKKKPDIPAEADKPTRKPRTKRNRAAAVRNLAEEKFAAAVIAEPEKPIVEIVQDLGVGDPLVASQLGNRWLESPSVKTRINEALVLAGIDKDHAAGMLFKQLFVSQEDFHDESGRFSFHIGVERGAMEAVEQFVFDRVGDIIGVKLPSKAKVVAVLAKIQGWEKAPQPPASLDDRMKAFALEILGDLKAQGMDEGTARNYMRDKFPPLYRRL